MIKKFNLFGKSEMKIIFTWIIRLVFGFTFIVVFVPLNPSMPSSNLDPSWKLGVNQAISQNLNFGDDIVFTFGPYASIYTGVYHPATDKLMMWGSILISISYIAMVIILAQPQRLWWLTAFSIFLSLAYAVDNIFLVRDPILFSYPVILALLIYQISLQPINKQRDKNSAITLIVILIGLFTIGMLPLIKGTMLIMVTAALFFSMVLLWVKHRKWIALVTAILPIISVPFHWVLARQVPEKLPIYFENLNQIISGYTDAMSKHGNLIDIQFFGIGAFFILSVIAIEKSFSRIDHIFLLMVYATFIFVGYKSGFVRHDEHGLLAAETLLMASFFLPLILKRKIVLPVISLACTISFVISSNYLPPDPQYIYNRIKRAYFETWHGIRFRTTNPDYLSHKFDRNIIFIQKELYIPRLRGTTDIYSYNQSYLLVSENTWSPRPVFQSYAAYTPYLLRVNEKHLRGVDAPENLLFRLETIDGRLPALDDGLSWSTIINYYCAEGIIGPYIHFKKRVSVSPASLATDNFKSVSSATYELGESADLPESKTPLQAEVTIEPTFLGKLFSLLYKLPEMRMTLTLTNNDKKDYRVIPSMMQTPFIISPLTATTADFLFLATNDKQLDESFVKRIKIYPDISSADMPASWIKLLWKPSYTIRFSPVRLHQEYDISQCD